MQLRVGSYTLKGGAADWRLDTAANGPLDLKLDLSGLQSTAAGNSFNAEQLLAELRGTVQSHQLSLRGTHRRA